MPKTSKKKAKKSQKRDRRPFGVTVYNSPNHSFDFVYRNLRMIIGASEEQATEMARNIHSKGKAIVFVGKKIAALKIAESIKNAGYDRDAASILRLMEKDHKPLRTKVGRVSKIHAPEPEVK
jgi:ATP-dependent Clp protease adapter protein ClpS